MTTAPLRIEVVLPVEGEHILPGRERDFWVEDYVVDRVEWRATRWAENGRVGVSVTAFTARHINRCWYREGPGLAEGLSTAPPPEWVPAAPAWFEAAVAEMQSVRADA